MAVAAKAGGRLAVRGLPPWKAKAARGLGMLVDNADIPARFAGEREEFIQRGPSLKPDGPLAPTLNESQILRRVSIEEMFGLETMPLLSWFERFLDGARWSPIPSLPNDAEYANIKGRPTDGYFTGKAPSKGMTLCRSKSHNRACVMLKAGDGLESWDMPQWRTEGGESLRITLALRELANNRPIAKITRRDRVASIEYDYLLPPAEQNFIEFFSWSGDGAQSELGMRLKRVVSTDLLDEFIRLFMRFGYEIQEVPA
jgi:hypothetical protein